MILPGTRTVHPTPHKQSDSTTPHINSTLSIIVIKMSYRIITGYTLTLVNPYEAPDTNRILVRSKENEIVPLNATLVDWYCPHVALKCARNEHAAIEPDQTVDTDVPSCCLHTAIELMTKGETIIKECIATNLMAHLSRLGLPFHLETPNCSHQWIVIIGNPRLLSNQPRTLQTATIWRH